MKVIFLDIDGVLNDWDWYCEADIVKDGFESLLDPKRIALIQQLVDLTGARICLSTSWRIDPQCKSMLINKGLGTPSTYIGQTPSLDGPRRNEISNWLAKHPEVTSYVVIDDDEDAGITNRFVHTDMCTGFTKEHLQEAVRILGKQCPSSSQSS